MAPPEDKTCLALEELCITQEKWDTFQWHNPFCHTMLLRRLPTKDTKWHAKQNTTLLVTTEWFLWQRQALLSQYKPFVSTMLPWMTDQFSPWVALRKGSNYIMLMQRRKRIDWHRNRKIFPDYFPLHFHTHMTPPYVSSSSSVNYSIFCGTGENQLESSYVGI